MEATSLEHYLSRLGLDAGAARAYLALHSLGPSSALQLAKATKQSRTQTYRHLEALQANGLASAEQLSYGTLFRALPLENIEATLAEREAETTSLRADLKTMTETLHQLAGAAGPKATTQHYYGLAGLKQVNWNLTKAKEEYRVFEAAHLSQHLDAAFARRCRERFIERQLTSYDLTNATEIKAASIEPFAPSRTFYRRLEPQLLAINFEVYIYNDVVTLLDYAKEHAQALEIHHPLLHQMMRQLFEAMWRLAEPLEPTY